MPHKKTPRPQGKMTLLKEPQKVLKKSKDMLSEIHKIQPS
jgi:hypothetical protein